MRKKEVPLYVFEVKSVSHRNTPHSPFHPIHRVTTKKIRKMRMFADYYLNKHPEYTGAALGVIIVSLAETLKKPEFEVVWI